jgi:hypothetical protein
MSAFRALATSPLCHVSADAGDAYRACGSASASEVHARDDGYVARRPDPLTGAYVDEFHRAHVNGNAPERREPARAHDARSRAAIAPKP